MMYFRFGVSKWHLATHACLYGFAERTRGCCVCVCVRVCACVCACVYVCVCARARV